MRRHHSFSVFSAISTRSAPIKFVQAKAQPNGTITQSLSVRLDNLSDMLLVQANVLL